MRTLLACAATLFLTACAPQTVQKEVVLTADEGISADHWTVWQSEDIFNEIGEQSPAGFEMIMAIIEGNEDGSFMVVGCVKSQPESAIVIVKTDQTVGRSGKSRLPVTIRSEDGANTILFDASDNAVDVYLDLRLSTGRHLLSAILGANKPIAVQVDKDPIVRFNPGNGVIKSIFAQCHEAQPSLGA